MAQNKSSIQYQNISKVGSRIIIRPYLVSDFDACMKAHQGRKSTTNVFDHEIVVHGATTHAEFQTNVEHRSNRGNLQEHFSFGVFEKQSAADYFGHVELWLLNKELRWGNIGCSIHNQYWGRGFGAEAMHLALLVAFKELNFHRIEGGTHVQNTAAAKTAENAGMVYEGIRKNFFPGRGGVDVVVYGANAIDYPLFMLS
jgi:[ribosomal protein S5]-alanine N-acetyltransferase